MRRTKTPPHPRRLSYRLSTAAEALGETGPERNLRDYLLTCYDMSDPVEAVEATLVGLGGRVTMLPRMLTEPQPPHSNSPVVYPN